MSETVARQRPSVDLDAFERRFRQTQPTHDDDPLAELARIVGDEPDPYGDVFARQPAVAPAHQDLRPSYAPHGRQEARQEPTLGGVTPRFSADFAAIEAGLRGALSQPQLAPGHDAQPDYTQTDYTQADYAEPDYAFPPGHEAAAAPAATWDQAREPARASARQKPVYGIAAAIVLAVAGIGVAFAYKGTGSSPREIKTIMAAAGPTKIQPPADKVDAADQDAAAAGQAAPTKLVTHEEQPVDLQQAMQDNAAAHGTDASSVPVPPAPGAASPDYGSASAQAPDPAGPAAAAPAYGDQGFGIGMPQPKRVKSVSVKPDGTIVSGSQDDASAAVAPNPAPPPAPEPDRIGALAQDASPALPAAKPARPAKTKSTTRVAAPVAPPPADAAGGADDAAAAKPAKPAKPTHKVKPVQVATNETGTDQAGATDAAANDEAKPVGAGAWAVQLGAPASEAEARSATSRFLKKYSGALHGRRLGFHRADSNGKTVYRIRVSSLTKEDASSLCGKLKADGGSCFIAKN